MKTSNKQTTLLAILITIVIIAVSVFFIKTISVEVLESSLKVNGLYGVEISYEDIEEVRELNLIPLWGMKTNGINLGFMNIGIFSYKELGKVRLFEIKKEKPYVLIIGKNERIVLGLGKEKNEEIYRTLEEKISKENK